MVRVASAGGLSRASNAGGYTFAVADAREEADIRALLCGNELGGWIRLSLERAPNAFAAGALFDRHEFLIVRERNGSAIALCEYSVRRRYVNGVEVRVPYLGGLRVERNFRHRVAVLKHGFAAVQQLLRDPSDYALPLTSITADNADALRLLCAGLDGLPRYLLIGDMVTLAATTRHCRRDGRIDRASEDDLPAIAALLRRTYARQNFAPVWNADDLAKLGAFGLPPERFLIAREADRVIGCIAVWDQRSFKQTVVRGYSRRIARVRPLYNALAPFIRSPRLPRPGASLNQVFLSHFALAEENLDLQRALLRGALSDARSLGAEVALIGVASNNPYLGRLRRLTSAREYRTQLHLVKWADVAAPKPSIDDSLQPEIALL